MRIYDQWIDFVNLRSEEYTENSRIPTMVSDIILFIKLLQWEVPDCLCFLVLSFYLFALLQKFGTAEEDAYRRDLTINRYSHRRSSTRSSITVILNANCDIL